MLATAAATVLVAGMASTGVASAQADTNPGPIVTGVLEDAVSNLGTTLESSTYGGLSASADGTGLTIYLTNLNPIVEAAFNALAPAGVLSFASTANSLSTLGSLHQTLEAAWPSLTTSGIAVNWFAPNQVSGKEDIGVVGLDDVAVATLDDLLGSANVNIVNVTAADAAAATLTVSRTADTSPFNGGDAVTNGTGGCTTGFGVTIGGHARLLTAAHCFATGNAVRNAKCGGNPFTCNAGTSMGSTVARDVAYHESSSTYSGDDTEYLSGAGSRLVFLGGVTTSTTGTVAGRLGNYVNDQVCQSGSYGGEVCGLVIQSTGGCKAFAEGYDTYDLCGLVEAHRNTAGAALVNGDSGGPVFRFSGSALYASGTNTAGDGTGGHIWFTDIGTELSIWGATLIT